MQQDTDAQLKEVSALCRDLFVKKAKDYGTSWRIMRPQSLTDQIYIKACRIRTLTETHQAWVDEGIQSEFIAIVNYGIIGQIQLTLPATTKADMTAEEAIRRYDAIHADTLALLHRKNHDYGEAWRSMRLGSLVDIILMKIQRVKQLEDNGGHAEVSEGIGAGYMDMVNYALFALIQLSEAEKNVAAV